MIVLRARKEEQHLNAVNRLLSSRFLFALTLLLLNDFILKDQYGNWFTGKLSDFAGLYAFTFFLLTVWPTHAKTIVAFTIVSFVLWKSSLSQPIIDVLNVYGLPFNRVIDLTDLIALPMVVLAAADFSKIRQRVVSPLLKAFLVSSSCFAFMATSYAPVLTPEERLLRERVHSEWPREYSSFDYPNRALAIPKSKDELILGLKLLTDYQLRSHWPHVPIFLVPFYDNHYSIMHKSYSDCVPNTKGFSDVTEVITPESLDRMREIPPLVYAAFEISDSHGNAVVYVSHIKICNYQVDGKPDDEAALAEFYRLLTR